MFARAFGKSREGQISRSFTEQQFSCHVRLLWRFSCGFLPICSGSVIFAWGLDVLPIWFMLLPALFFLKVSYASSCCILRSPFFHIFRLHDYFVSVHLIPHILILVFLPSFSLHSAMLFQFPYPDGLGQQQGPSPRSCTLHSCIRCPSSPGKNCLVSRTPLSL